jgi:hypothetical protein
MDRKEATEFLKNFLNPKKTETSYEELLKAREAENIDRCNRRKRKDT